MIEIHPENHRIGYARASTYGQTLDAQLEPQRGAGCIKIYRHNPLNRAGGNELAKILTLSLLVRFGARRVQLVSGGHVSD
jgi:hypothetical protein